MGHETKTLTAEQVAQARAGRQTAMHLQAIESNPLDAEDVAMFKMFERECWSHERRREHLNRMGQEDDDSAMIEAVAFLKNVDV